MGFAPACRSTTAYAVGELMANASVIAPPGCNFNLRSCRSDLASAAISLNAAAGRVNYVGGWIQGIPTMERHYVDYTFVADAYSRWFFGHLVVR